ncbi:MAG: hypothetical protein H6865_01755 [Rhodospirillales bacterium]|nr:hypothetical protein [Alphaproteobacteria bacterium]MCB9986344.1 hypothetical protein [Rhodospirillales bacterium]USO07106.1 MAG: hypothetical protein H6866_06630 [Rhodospirillales bacterium]
MSEEIADPLPVSTPPMVDSRKSVLRCYLLLGVSLPLAFSPIGVLAGPFFLAMIAGVIWAYRLRGRADPMAAMHGRWMVRTFWISSIFFVVGMLAAGALIHANADQTPLIETLGQYPSVDAVPEDVRISVITRFYELNARLMLMITLGCMAPPLLYTLARLIRGGRMAHKGQDLPNVKSWWL